MLNKRGSDKENMSFCGNCSQSSIDLNFDEEILKPQMILSLKINPRMIDLNNSCSLLFDSEKQEIQLKQASFERQLTQFTTSFHKIPLSEFHGQPQIVKPRKAKEIAEMASTIKAEGLFFFSGNIKSERSNKGHLEQLYIQTAGKKFFIAFKLLENFKESFQKVFSDPAILKISFASSNLVNILFAEYELLVVNLLDIQHLEEKNLDITNQSSLFKHLKMIDEKLIEEKISLETKRLQEFMTDQQAPQSDMFNRFVNSKTRLDIKQINKILKWRRLVAEQEDEDEQFILSNESLTSIFNGIRDFSVKEKYKPSVRHLLSENPATQQKKFRWEIEKSNLTVNLDYLQKQLGEEIDQKQSDYSTQIILEGIKQYFEQVIQLKNLEFPLSIQNLLQNNQISAKNLQRVPQKMSNDTEEQIAFKFVKDFIKIINRRTDRREAARSCDSLLEQLNLKQKEMPDYLGQFQVINLEEALDNIEHLQLEVQVLPETFDEYIKDLPLIKQKAQKKPKKTKGDEFTAQEIKQLEDFLAIL